MQGLDDTKDLNQKEEFMKDNYPTRELLRYGTRRLTRDEFKYKPIPINDLLKKLRLSLKTHAGWEDISTVKGQKVDIHDAFLKPL